MTCIVPNKRIDIPAARRLNTTPKFVRFLKAEWSSVHPESDWMSMTEDEVVSTLEQCMKQMADGTLHPDRNAKVSTEAATIERLNSIYSAQQRHDRVVYIAERFMDLLDYIHEKYPALSTVEILRGVTEEGETILFPDDSGAKVPLNVDVLFDSVNQALREEAEGYLNGFTVEEIEAALEETQDESQKAVLENSLNYYYNLLEMTGIGNFGSWSHLVQYSKSLINMQLDTKLSLTDNTIKGEEVNDAATKNIEIDLEESEREHWMIKNDQIDPRRAKQEKVRRYLHKIGLIKFRQDEIGNPVIDEVTGFPVLEYEYTDIGTIRKPKWTALDNRLTQVFRDCRTKSDVLERIELFSQVYPEIAQMYLDLRVNPLNSLGDYAEDATEKEIAAANKVAMDEATARAEDIISALATAYHKDYQPVAALEETKLGAHINSVLKYLNSNSNPAMEAFKKKVFHGAPKDFASNSIFSSHRKLLLDKTKYLKEVIDRYFKPDDNGAIKFTSLDMNGKGSKRSVLTDILSAFGLTVSQKDVMDMLTQHQFKVNKILTDLQKWGFRGITDGTTTNSALYKNGDESNLTQLGEAISKLASLVSSVSEDFQYVKSASYKNDKGQTVTMFYNVNPSFMGDRIGDIRSICDAAIISKEQGIGNLTKDQLTARLHEWITSNYPGTQFLDVEDLDSDGQPQPYKGTWLRELWDSDITDEKSFAFKWSHESNIRLKTSINSNGNKEFENFSAKQHLSLLFASYVDRFNDGKAKELPSYSAFYPSFILGDSGVQKLFSGISYNLRSAEGRQRLIEGYYSIYKSEFNRMKLMDAMIEDLKSKGVSYPNAKIKWEKNNRDFALMPMFGKDGMGLDVYKKGENEKQLTLEEFTEKFENYILGKELLGKVADHKLPKESKEFTAFKEFVHSKGFLTKDKGGHTTVKEVFDKSKETTEDEFLFDFYLNYKLSTANQMLMMSSSTMFYENTKDLQKRFKEIHAPGESLVKDYSWWNPVTNKVEFFARKDKDGNYKETQKAAYFKEFVVNEEAEHPEVAKMIFLGLMPDRVKASQRETIDRVNEIFNKTELNSAERDKALEEIINDVDAWDMYKKYRKNKLTDGQSYRSFSSYKSILGMAGKWNTTYEKAYNRLQEFNEQVLRGEELTSEQMKEATKLAAVFNPFKPFYYGFEQYQLNDNMGIVNIPVQHKCSEAILIPCLLNKGSKLRELAQWMEEEDADGTPKCDVFCSTEVVKVGGYGFIDLADVNAGDIKTTLDNGIRIANWDKSSHVDGEVKPEGQGMLVHYLDLEGYKLQTAVPDHLDHKQLFGTQARKLSLAGIQFTGKNYLGDYFGREGFKIKGQNGVERTVSGDGYGLMTLYNQLITANVLDSYNKFMRAIATDENVSELLIKSIFNDNNVINDHIYACSVENGELKFALCDGHTSEYTSALLLSTFRKLVNKQTIKGGSAVQMSSYGIAGLEEDTSGRLKVVVDPTNEGNALYDEVEIAWDFNYKDSMGNKVELDIADYAYTEGPNRGEFILSNKKVYGKEAREYLSWPSMIEVDGKMVQETTEDGQLVYRVPKIETEFKGILSGICYRIPTERDYSMLNYKVVRVTPKVSGSVIKVPAYGTTRGGWDYDIDKLYMMRKEFVSKHLSTLVEERDFDSNVLDNIWSRVYRENPSIKKGLSKAREEVSKDITIASDRKSLVKKLSNVDSEFKAISNPTDEDIMRAASKWNRTHPEDLIVIKSYSPLYDKKGKEDGSRPQYNVPLNRFWDSANVELLNKKVKLSDMYDKQALFQESAKYEDLSEITKEVEKKNEWVKYNWNRTALENSRVARNNMLIEIMRQRLMDPETINKRVTPGGFAHHSHTALVMRNLEYSDVENLAAAEERSLNKELDPEPNYDYTNPQTLIYFNQQNQIAGKLIGVFADHNSNQALVSLMNKFELKRKVRLGSQVDNGEAGYASLYQGRRNTPEALKKQSQIDLLMAEFLSASVDAVKDPVLNYMNINEYTANVAALLTRLGYDSIEVGLFLNQPIIKEMIRRSEDNGYSIETNIKMFLNDSANGIDSNNYDLNSFNTTSALSTDALVKAIVSNRKQPLYGESAKGITDSGVFRTQAVTLLQFKELLQDAASIQKFVRMSKFTASNTVPSTFGKNYALEDTIEAFKTQMDNDEDGRLIIEMADRSRMSSSQEQYWGANNININLDSKLDASGQQRERLIRDKEAYMSSLLYHPYAYEQAMFDALDDMKEMVISRYYPYESKLFKMTREKLKGIVNFSMDASTYDTWHQDLIAYTLSSSFGPFSNVRDYRGYATRIFPAVFNRIVEENPELRTAFPIIDAITPSTFSNSSGVTYESFYMSRVMEREDSDNEIIDSWRELLTITESEWNDIKGDSNLTAPQLHKIGIMLYLNQFFKYGFQDTPKSFLQKAPTIIKEILKDERTGKSLNEALWDMVHDKVKPGDINIEKFTLLEMLNHLDNKRFVTNLPFSSKLYDLCQNKYEAGESGIISLAGDNMNSEINKEIADYLTVSVDKNKHSRTVKPIIKLSGKWGQDFTSKDRYYLVTTTEGLELEQDGYVSTEELALNAVHNTQKDNATLILVPLNPRGNALNYDFTSDSMITEHTEPIIPVFDIGEMTRLFLNHPESLIATEEINTVESLPPSAINSFIGYDSMGVSTMLDILEYLAIELGVSDILVNEGSIDEIIQNRLEVFQNYFESMNYNKDTGKIEYRMKDYGDAEASNTMLEGGITEGNSEVEEAANIVYSNSLRYAKELQGQDMYEDLSPKQLKAEIDNLTAKLKNGEMLTSQDELNLINAIKTLARKDGVLMMDENKMLGKSCK